MSPDDGGKPTLDYTGTTPRNRPNVASITLQALTLYFAASIVTLPFINRIWLGELPVLAVIQLPKLALADWIRSGVVMRVMSLAGLSSGSFSPDFIAARPYALLLTYAITFGIVLVTLRLCRARPPKPWIWISLVAAAIDCVVILRFGSGPGLSIY